MIDYDNYRPHMLPKVRSKSIMAEAKGKPCTLRISSLVPGHKCSGHDTTVSAHLPVWGKGTSTKVTDMATAFACDNCHAILDGRDMTKQAYLVENYNAAVLERLLGALTETHAILIQEGVIVIPDNSWA